MILQTSDIPRSKASRPRRPAFPVPSFWVLMRNTVRRLVRGPLAPPPPNAARDSLLLDASLAIRAGRVHDASEVLAAHGSVLACDPAYLNLLGVLCEVRRQWRLAQRFYGVAISIAPRFGPAQQNMRRLYELHSFGRSQEPLALGDAELGRLGEPRVNVPELNLALDRGGAR